MKISAINNSIQYHNTTRSKKVSFTKKQDNFNDNNYYERYLIYGAAAALASLAIAQAGGKIILNQHRDRINEILDKYEREIVEFRKTQDLITNEQIKILNFDTDSIP